MNFITEESAISLRGNVVYYFYANWIPFHKRITTILNKMHEKYPHIRFEAVNVDDFKTTIKRFSLESLPTILVFKRGVEEKRIVGLVMTSAVKAVLNDIFKEKENNEKRKKTRKSN